MTTYRSLVEAQCLRNPSLLSLCNFLSDSNSSHEPCRIASLDFFADVISPRKRTVDIQRLRSELLYGKTVRSDSIDDYLQHEPRDGSQFLGQILIVEDLSKELIDILGSSLDVDPLFFASHVNASWKELETQTPDLATLPSRTTASNYINVHYHRTISFDKVSPPRKRLRRVGNIDRKVMAIPSVKNKWIGLAQHCVSILRTTRDTHWIGLVLVDPPIGDNFLFDNEKKNGMVSVHLPSQLFLGGYEDFLAPPSVHDYKDRRSGPGRLCLMEDLLYYWSLKPPSSFNPKNPSLLCLSHYPLSVVAAEWVKYLGVMYRGIKQYEYRSNESRSFIQQLEILNSDMRDLQSWRRRIISSQQKVLAVARVLQASETSDLRTSLVGDYEHLAANIEGYGRRLESMLPVVTSLVQIVDSRRSFAETANISRLTILALIFVPLSFVASLFSMNANNIPGGPYFWVYFAVAVPVTIAVYLVARPPVRAFHFIMRRVQKRKKQRRSVEETRAHAEAYKNPEV